MHNAQCRRCGGTPTAWLRFPYLAARAAARAAASAIESVERTSCAACSVCILHRAFCIVHSPDGPLPGVTVRVRASRQLREEHLARPPQLAHADFRGVVGA